jgi:hypothetical protein
MWHTVAYIKPSLHEPLLEESRSVAGQEVSHLAATRGDAKLAYAVDILVNGVFAAEVGEEFAVKIVARMSIEEALVESHRSPAPRRQITGAVRRDPTPRGR